MIVWIVGVSDCEANSIKVICTTKEIAERELFEVRDTLISEWERCDVELQRSDAVYCKDHKIKFCTNDMYKKMISALSGNNYEKWNNYPYDNPYLYATDVMEE